MVQRKAKKRRPFCSLNFRVTQEHINYGSRGNNAECPVALALKDQGLDDVLVSEDVIDTGLFVFQVPAKVHAFISAFDKGKKVRPIYVRLAVY